MENIKRMMNLALILSVFALLVAIWNFNQSEDEVSHQITSVTPIQTEIDIYNLKSTNFEFLAVKAIEFSTEEDEGYILTDLNGIEYIFLGDHGFIHGENYILTVNPERNHEVVEWAKSNFIFTYEENFIDIEPELIGM